VKLLEKQYSECSDVFSVLLRDRRATYSRKEALRNQQESIWARCVLVLVGTLSLCSASVSPQSALPESLKIGAQDPIITVQPRSANRKPGESVTFSVVASGTGPFLYEWRKDNVHFGGVYSSNLVLYSVRGADAGAYKVVVSAEV
jgi:hypothetical protein